MQMFIWSLMRMKLQIMKFTKRFSVIFVIDYFQKFIWFYKHRPITFNIVDSYTTLLFFLFVNMLKTYLKFLFLVVTS